MNNSQVGEIVINKIQNMSIFTLQHTMVEILEHDSELLPVLNRFGIRLGCGDKTLIQLCEQNGVSSDFVLAILNVYHNETYFPERKLSTFDISPVIQYLVETHRYYFSYVIPEIENQFGILKKQKNIQKELLVILEKMFITFKNEYKRHITEEENKIFPVIHELWERESIDRMFKLKVTSLNLTNIHSRLDDKIIDIKNILIKYLPPMDDVNQFNAFAMSIFRFEKDLKDHSRIEERILYPRVEQMLNQKMEA